MAKKQHFINFSVLFGVKNMYSYCQCICIHMHKIHS